MITDILIATLTATTVSIIVTVIIILICYRKSKGKSLSTLLILLRGPIKGGLFLSVDRIKGFEAPSRHTAAGNPLGNRRRMTSQAAAGGAPRRRRRSVG